MLIENASLGLLILSVIFIPHSTVRLVATDVVSAIRVESEALVLYIASMLRLLSNMSPLKFTVLPSCITKSLLTRPRATNL